MREKIRQILHTIWEYLTKPSKKLSDPRKQLEARIVAFMVLVIILGVGLNIIFVNSMPLWSLASLLIGFIFSRTKQYQVATYIILAVLAASVYQSVLTDNDFDNLRIFGNVAWLAISLVFASLLLSIRETILISGIQIVMVILLIYFEPEINLRSVGISLGFLGMFSGLIVLTMWQRNLLEAFRQKGIRWQATHDQLTGLPNRGLFYDRLNQALTRARRNQSIGAVLYLDLDDFKNINDEFSHEVGDQVLKIIARRIEGCIRETDTAARISGDEFVVMLEDVQSPHYAEKIGWKIIEMIGSPIQVEDSEVFVRGSIGIAMFPKDGDMDDELLQNADVAMYEAKAEGKGFVAFFTEEMKREILKNATLSREFSRAIAENEFNFLYQPQVNLEDLSIIGAESLIRWYHPKQGEILPGDFIPVFERSGAILEVGAWGIEKAVSLLDHLAQKGADQFKLAVNISGRQIRDENFLPSVEFLLAKSVINPRRLELELTESILFENIEQAKKVLHEIRSMGARVAIDDFGTGFSSLSYLERLPIDTLKIDISFVQRITSKEDNFPILGGIITIASEIGLDIIAEGVENQVQSDFLLAHGCHLAQGYLFSRPVELVSLEGMIWK